MKYSLVLGFFIALSLNEASGQQAQAPIPGSCLSGGTRVFNLLNNNIVTTGGTAVIALNAGQARCGGEIVSNNAVGICVDEIQSAGTITGTPSSTICVPTNVTFTLVPTANSIYINASASGVVVGGFGLN